MPHIKSNDVEPKIEPQIKNLIELAELCSEQTGKSLSSIARECVFPTNFFARLKQGHNCRVDILNKACRVIDGLMKDASANA